MLWDVAVKDFGGSGGCWVCCGLRKMLRVHVVLCRMSQGVGEDLGVRMFLGGVCE